MGTDWGLAFSVCAYGLTAVFTVLIVLMIAIYLSSAIINSFQKKDETQKAGN